MREFIVKNDMATYDFTTMYTAFSLETLVNNIIKAIQEAQQFEASKKLPQSMGCLV